MSGIQYVTDDNGRRIAVQIDLQKYANLWEDFEDALLTKERLKEPQTSLDTYEEERKRYSFEKAIEFWDAHRVDLSHFTFNREEANGR
jgi:hypothetical protein